MLEVGDNRHTLMFEMIGDWSLGDFTKEQQIPWIMELWVKVYGMDPNRLYVSVFAGDEDAPRDNLAIELWKKAFRQYGVAAEFSEDIHAVPGSLAETKG
jgi:alanyl-tRNA synthetase